MSEPSGEPAPPAGCFLKQDWLAATGLPPTFVDMETHTLNFGESLSSDSMKSHSAAALFLRAEGANGYQFVPMLLQRCQAIDLSQATLNKLEETLVGYGALSLGTILGAHGFDIRDDLHANVLQWLIELTFSTHIQIAASAIYGVGDLRPLPRTAQERLIELVNSVRRTDDHLTITCRGIAFRVLAKADRDLAKLFVDSPACAEYLNATDHWIEHFRETYPENHARCREIKEESLWLRK